MDTKEFGKALTGYLRSPGDLAEYADLRDATEGMSSPFLGKMLNLATGFLDTDESYVEVGTFKGYSLMSAAKNRKGTFLGIDDFSQFGDMGVGEDVVRTNIQKFGHDGVRFINDDFRNVSLSNTRAGLYYYDGNHSYKDTMDGLEWGSHLTTGSSLIMVDDFGLHCVESAVLDWLQRRRDWHLMFACNNTELGKMVTPDDWSKVFKSQWWMGTCILHNS